MLDGADTADVAGRSFRALLNALYGSVNPAFCSVVPLYTKEVELVSLPTWSSVSISTTSLMSLPT